MIKGMKKFTALLLTAVMIVSVIVNSDIMLNYASNETDVVPSVKMDSSLLDGDRNCIQVWPSQVDDFTFTSDWVDRPVRIAGGVYVDGKLNTGCTLIRFSNFYYIALSDGQVDVEEGTTVVFDGIYGRCSNDPKYGDNYTVKFNKSTFEYTNGSWIQK